jgi:acyl-CoA thioesterase-1
VRGDFDLYGAAGLKAFITSMILRFLLSLILLTLTACGSEQPKYPSLVEGAVVLAFGDSITHGTGARSGEDYPSVLAQRTGWQLVNAGLPGDTADRARERIAPLLDKHAPELVIIELRAMIS